MKPFSLLDVAKRLRAWWSAMRAHAKSQGAAAGSKMAGAGDAMEDSGALEAEKERSIWRGGAGRATLWTSFDGPGRCETKARWPWRFSRGTRRRWSFWLLLATWGRESRKMASLFCLAPSTAACGNG